MLKTGPYMALRWSRRRCSLVPKLWRLPINGRVAGPGGKPGGLDGLSLYSKKITVDDRMTSIVNSISHGSLKSKGERFMQKVYI